MQRTLQGTWQPAENENIQNNKPDNNIREFFRKIINNKKRLTWLIIGGTILFAIFPGAALILFIVGVVLSVFKVSPISIIGLLIIIPIIRSIISSVGKSSDIPDLSKTNVLACKAESTDDKALCVEDTIKNINDEWLRKCVEGNIDSKTQLATEIKSSQIQDSEINDIDGLIKECTYYKTTQLAGQDNNNYPILTSFITSAAGSFVGNYVANKLFYDQVNNQNNNYNGFNYGSFGGGNYGGYKSTTPTDRTSNMGSVDTQYKNDSWNIQSMKSKSAANSNYKLGDSGQNWLNTVYRNSSKSSSWSTYKSSSSSSSWSTKSSSSSSAKSSSSSKSSSLG